ncbi:MAG TPA: RidA family protein [Hyphomonadaceae bacterium]|nr:RidA family protein [Hyphomonadaceae bacterium]
MHRSLAILATFLLGGCVVAETTTVSAAKDARAIIDTPNAPRTTAPIAQAVRSNGLLFVSGTTPLDTNLQIAKGDFDAQFKQVMTNMGATLKAGGTDFAHVVKCTVMLARVEDWPRMNELYAGYWSKGNYPARTAFQAPLPSPDFLVEVECVAEVP